MSSRPASARALAPGRRAFPWLVAAAALLVRPRALELASPASCPGLLDVIAIGSLLVDPYVSAGTLLRAIDAVVVAGATAGFAQIVMRATNSFAVAAAVAVAVVLSPLFPPTFETPQAAGIFAACAAIVMVAATPRAPASPGSLRQALQTSGVLLAAALIVPQWTVFMALAAGVIVSMTANSRGGRPSTTLRALVGIAAMSIIGLAALALLNVSRPDALQGSSSWRSVAICAIPAPDFSLARVAAVIRATGWALGPLVVGLAILGTFTRWRSWRGGGAWVMAGLIGVLTTIGGVPAPVAGVPLAFVCWCLAAIGLHETTSAVGRRGAARVVCALVLVLLPTLQFARRNAEERDDRVPLNGHEHLSLHRIRALLNVIDVNSSIAEEDASVDLALRATAMSRWPAKHFVVVPRQADAITRALASGPAYAFPRGQADLGLRGFVLRPIGSVRRQRNRAPEEISGFAAIVGRRPCQTMHKEWQDIGETAAGGKIAVTAEGERSIGPVTLILGGTTAPVLVTEAWTTRMIRGFHFRAYDRRDPAEADLLLADARTLAVPLDHRALTMPFVLQLSVHRIPRGALALPVILGGSFPEGIARLDASDESQQLSVCDASAAHVTPIEVR